MGVSGVRAGGAQGQCEALPVVLIRTQVLATCERGWGHSGQAVGGGLGVQSRGERPEVAASYQGEY